MNLMSWLKNSNTNQPQEAWRNLRLLFLFTHKSIWRVNIMDEIKSIMRLEKLRIADCSSLIRICDIVWSFVCFQKSICMRGVQWLLNLQY